MGDTLVLSAAERELLASARRAVLATVAPSGRPRLVPICFVVRTPPPGQPGLVRLYSPLDEKPKRVGDVRRLARVTDLLARPEVTVLVDRWDEDWSRLAWLRLDGAATLIEPSPAPSEHAEAVAALLEKHPQYASHDLGRRPMIAITITRATGWGASPAIP